MSSRNQTSSSGFTLLEVLVALILLAVGLMGLQAVGVSAAQANARAERNSRAAAVATQYMETAIGQIRSNQPPTQLCVVLPTGERVSVRVQTSTPHSLTRPYLTVEVTPRGATSPYLLESYAHSRSVVSPTGAPC